MKIGMRSLKTAIAVSLCVVVSKILNLGNGFYAAIAAIISMAGTISNSFIVGRNRIMGTIVGAAIGLICALIQPNNALFCGLGLLVVIWICNLLNWNKSVSIAGIVFMAIMVNLEGRSPWFYSLNRIIETLIGISIAVAVNYLILPPNYIKKMFDDCGSIEETMSNLIESKALDIKCEHIEALEAQIFDLKHQVRDEEKEFRTNKKRNIVTNNIKETIAVYVNILAHLKVINNLVHKCSLDNLEVLEGCQVITNENAESEVHTILNYSVREIKSQLENVKYLIQETGKLIPNT